MSQLPPTHEIIDPYRCHTPATRDNDSSQHEVGILFFLSNSSLCGPVWVAWRALGTAGSLQDSHGQSCVCSLCSHMEQWHVTCVLPVQHVLHLFTWAICSSSCSHPWTSTIFHSSHSQPSFSDKLLSSGALASFYSFLPLALLLFCNTFAVVSLLLCSF